MMPHKVTSRLFTGSKMTPQIMQWCRSEGITHVLNVAQELNDSPGQNPDRPAMLKIGTNDTGSPKMANWLQPIQTVTSHILEDPTNKLLIHCHAGKNRSTSAAYLVLRTFGLSTQDAYRLSEGGSAPRYAADVDRFLHQQGNHRVTTG